MALLKKCGFTLNMPELTGGHPSPSSHVPLQSTEITNVLKKVLKKEKPYRFSDMVDWYSIKP